MSKLNLRQAREKAGVSVEFVAEQMGVSVELIRELDTELAEVYMVRIPVITCGVRDNSYVLQTKEIYLADPELEAFIHQFRHHLQNEARELSRKYLLMEDDPKADYRIPYREANSMLYGEDDAVAWSRFLMENC